MENIQIEIVVIEKENTLLVSLILPLGSRIKDGLRIFFERDRSERIRNLFDGVVEGRVGIFGKVMPLDTLLKNGDRIEIYQPLLQDPKERRRQRAKQAKGKYTLIPRNLSS